MAAGKGNSAQGGAPTEARRLRFVNFVRDQAASGHLSSADLDDRVEQIFRARSIPELDAVVADLPGASVLTLDAALAGEWQPAAPGNSWFKHLVIYTAVIDAFGVVVWALTGGGAIWLVLLLMCSAAVFAFRVMRRGKGIITGGFQGRK